MRTGKPAGAGRGDNRNRSAASSHRDDVLARLASRRVNYTQVKKTVQFDLPQMQLAFARRFGRHKISKVLGQIERWRALLENDFLVRPDLKTGLEQWINFMQLFAYQTVLEKIHPQLGSLKLETHFIPAREGRKGKPFYGPPSLQITVIDQETNDKRHVTISGEELNNPARAATAFRMAFEKLGLLNLLLQEPKGRLLVSAHRPQAWPVFAQFVIPRLYEYLLPFYPKPAHYSVDLDRAPAVVRRPAFYPKELLEDMLDILRTEHPTFFAQATVGQLKAHIQRYLRKRTKSPNQA